jgi:hypothetical protein
MCRPAAISLSRAMIYRIETRHFLETQDRPVQCPSVPPITKAVSNQEISSIGHDAGLVASSQACDLHSFGLARRQPRNDLINSWLMAQAVCAPGAAGGLP